MNESLTVFIRCCLRLLSQLSKARLRPDRGLETSDT